MGRPALALGTCGNIRFASAAGGWRAKARFRGYDGVIRDISRSASSKAKAKRDLLQAVAQELQTPSGGEITAKSRFREVADLWFAWQERRVAQGERATGTLDNYRSMLANHVLPALGELRLHEVTVPRLDRFFPALLEKSSAAHTRTARAVVGGVLRYAVRHGAITTNPIRDIEPIEGGRRNKARAMTPDERRSWLAQLELDPKAVRKDLPDLTRFMMATGVRIGEALALRWQDVDLAAGTISIQSTAVRVIGEGLQRRPPKSTAGERVLALPTWAVEMLSRRWKAADAENRPSDSPVFPDAEGGLRDPSNTRRALREARGSDEFAWVTSHVFRKTAATILDDAGLKARVIADHLGHAKPSMTQDVYMGRGITSPDAADALEDLL